MTRNNYKSKPIKKSSKSILFQIEYLIRTQNFSELENFLSKTVSYNLAYLYYVLRTKRVPKSVKYTLIKNLLNDPLFPITVHHSKKATESHIYFISHKNYKFLEKLSKYAIDSVDNIYELIYSSLIEYREKHKRSLSEDDEIPIEQVLFFIMVKNNPKVDKDKLITLLIIEPKFKKYLGNEVKPLKELQD